MKSYTHFTLSERIFLQENYKKLSIRKIASILGRSPSTIQRELKRNWSKKKKRYNSWGANVKYIERRKNCHRKNNIEYDKQLYDFVLTGLLNYWSPEIIAGKWNLVNKNKISFNSIYRAIYTGLFPAIKPESHLRRRKKPYANTRKSYSDLFKEVSIHSRPSEADERSRFGDLEGDTIYGSVGKGYLVSVVDRRSRYLYLAKADTKSAENINAAFSLAFEKAKLKLPIKTLTLDNGSEFCGYKDIEKAHNIKVYFADTHSPWQRGSNENINDVIRFFFPRGTNFQNVDEKYIDYVADLINNRPRKCLGFLSPIEFIQQSVALGLTI